MNLERLEERTLPAVFTVGAGDVATLIADINTANGNGQSNVIVLTASTYDFTSVNNDWYGPNALPAITSNLTILGQGAVLQRDGSGGTPAMRLFYVSGGMTGELPLGTLTLEDVTLANGLAQGGDGGGGGGGGLGAGGAVFNQGALTLDRVTLANNQAVGGSGNGVGGGGGGGMGGNASGGNGGGFGSGWAGGYGGLGGTGSSSNGGGGFVTGANGSSTNGVGGGLGKFGGDGRNVGTGGTGGDGGGGGDGSTPYAGNGGDFGFGGTFNNTTGTDNGGGGGVGGGGGAGGNGYGGGGGFGGGGGGGGSITGGGAGGFGGGGGTTNGAGFGGGGGSSQGGGGGAGLGGAIFNMGASNVTGSGTLILVNSTLTGNTAQGGSGGTGANGGSGYGGAIFNLDGDMTLNDDTVSGNTTTAGSSGGGSGLDGVSDGGAVYHLAFGNLIQTGAATSATLTLNNSILSNSSGGSSDLAALVASGTFANTGTITGSTNLVQTLDNFNATLDPTVITTTADPLLGSLQNNGGLTPTLALSSDSPAYQAGLALSGISTDQRGFVRPAAGVTLGAFDPLAVPPSPSSPPPSTPAPPPSASLPTTVGVLFLAEDEFVFTVDSILSRLSSDPQILQAADHLMMWLNGLFGLNNPDLATGLANVQAALTANPFAGTPWGLVAQELALELAIL